MRVGHAESEPDRRVLVLTPTGRDAEMTCAVLREAGVSGDVCPGVSELCETISEGAGAALIAEEVLTRPALGALAQALAAQPAWSDFPLIILASTGRGTLESRVTLAELGVVTNATVLERPLRKATLISALRVALRSRERQYELRSHLEERSRMEAEREDVLRGQRRIAETLQRSLLKAPALDAFPNLEVVTQYAPAWNEAMIGGDFFDVFGIGDRVALVVGDVVGKGLPAASQMAEMKFALRAIVMQEPRTARALARLNRYAMASAPDDPDADPRLVAVLLAILNISTGRAEVAVAGAEAPVVLRASGGARSVSVSGVPIGVMEKADYQSARVSLKPGDLLMLATDGITESRRDGVFFGPEGLIAASLASPLSDSLEAAAEYIVSTARAYSGGAFRDDVCLLMARWRG